MSTRSFWNAVILSIDQRREMLHDTNSITMSIEFVEEDSSVNENIGYVSGLSADEVDEEPEDMRILDNNNYNKPSMSKAFTQQTAYNIQVCDRLYREAKEKEKKRAIEVKEKLDQENSAMPPKLKLATKRSYTPMRTRPSFENVHDHLYSLSRKKQIEVEQKRDEMEAIEANLNKVGISPRQSKVVSGRLYERSLQMQQEGKQMRKDIEKKLAPRSPTPSKKIPLSRAEDMYKRGLSQKARMERKIEQKMNAPRESTFPRMRTQSRTRAQSSTRERSETPSRALSRRSSRTPSRRSSETPGRQRSQTPSRRDSSRCRSSTPSRRNENSKDYKENVREESNNSSNNNDNNRYIKRGKNVLPPTVTSIKTREQSPDLRS